MSKSNKRLKKKIEKKYGKGCMFERYKIAQKIERIGGIKTYKRFLEEKRYTESDKNRLTVHHLIHVSEGGENTVENTAEINEVAHRYIHSLKRDEEEIINDFIRKGKRVQVELEDDLEFDFEVNMIEMMLDSKGKIEAKKYDRSKKKKEDQKIKKSWEDR